jgi:hypothetical protein
MTTNFERATEMHNQIGKSVQDAAIENSTIYRKTFDAYAEFNNNILNAWASWR